LLQAQFRFFDLGVFGRESRFLDRHFRAGVLHQRKVNGATSLQLGHSL
jgi:hypothetical protein